MTLLQSTRWSYNSNLFNPFKLVSRKVALNHQIGPCNESHRTWNLSSKSLGLDPHFLNSNPQNSQSSSETWLKRKHPKTTKPCIICPFPSQNKQWINALIYSSEQCSFIRYELQLDYLKFKVVQGQLVNKRNGGSIQG